MDKSQNQWVLDLKFLFKILKLHLNYKINEYKIVGKQLTIQNKNGLIHG